MFQLDGLYWHEKDPVTPATTFQAADWTAGNDLLDDLLRVEIIKQLIFSHFKFFVRKWRIGNKGLKMRNGLNIKLNSYLIHG